MEIAAKGEREGHVQRAERTESRGAVGLSVISTSTISNNLGMSLVFQMPLRIMPVSTKKKARVARLARYRYAPAVVLLFPSAPARPQEPKIHVKHNK